jgi:hypothetical protein
MSVFWKSGNLLKAQSKRTLYRCVQQEAGRWKTSRMGCNHSGGFSMFDLDQFNAECDRGARINAMADFFSATAAGRSGMPAVRPVADDRLLQQDALMRHLTELHASRQGFFDRHYHASIPYRLEEELRMAYAIFRYAMERPSPLSLYTMGAAEGTMARVLAELACGQIISLSCSASEENLASFMAYGEPEHARFFLGPFHHLTRARLAADPKLSVFGGGFDIVLEDTTFQMYSPNRADQIEFLSQHLADDGILLLLEKFTSTDQEDYLRREQQKDHGFKARFFSHEQLASKAATVLGPMHRNEVTIAEIAGVLKDRFRHCLVTWNSGNFYGLAASNSWNNLVRYLAAMPSPAIPREYIYWHRLLQPGFSTWQLAAAVTDGV